MGLSKPCQTRRVEYYRLWGGDSGTWDTDYIDIPADTPDDMVDKAIRKAAETVQWRDEPPVIVGYYSAACEDEEDVFDADDESSIAQVTSSKETEHGKTTATEP